MSEPLWNWDELVAAAGGRASGTPAAEVAGVSIDTRTLQPGDLFVALQAERDGHDFVGNAFKAGAAAALVSKSYRKAKGDGVLIKVEDTLAALQAIGRAARVRSNARIVAVTGSAGKTGTKEMLRLAFSEVGATHASEKSYNNHWGVPLTLARMPKTAQFGVFEIGMNHVGEITPLTAMVRPHAAVITTVDPVHLEYFGSVEAIAEAKAEIFQGLVPGGTAILPRDNAHFALLKARADAVGAKVVSFGYADTSDVRAIQANLEAGGSSVIAGVGSRRFPYRVGAPGGAVREELARRACRADRARRRSHARPAGFATGGGGAGTRCAHRACGRRRPHPADRRELQRQSGLGAGSTGRHGDYAARGLSAACGRARRHARAG
jgi:UDP-N-acetylmuramoyl-tripeptide--D-alanyl-D-alanine ligase